MGKYANIYMPDKNVKALTMWPGVLYTDDENGNADAAR